ncbi:hypothetical protein L1N85_10790 [Paenibacillus alkaliterrae]|uniref:hypothetical protein n=1 Tax=Paenibacillus alkaliterrae TaxID=320909 RepID=UPI001F3AE7F9|nr:hypothetical protein [Paenibacillus alkaliterrae]MCF2938922.1 hypothetical protein [Paenibacillus alkaliterrae]
MFKSTKIHWQWTAHTEQTWQRHNIEPRKAGQMLTELDERGYRVKRLTVPRSWVEKGLVQEAEEEQIDLLDII